MTKLLIFKGRIDIYNLLVLVPAITSSLLNDGDRPV